MSDDFASRRPCNTGYTTSPGSRSWTDEFQAEVHGGETKLGNLVTLCRFHHRYVHEENITIHTQPNGNWRFQKGEANEWTTGSPSRCCCSRPATRSRSSAGRTQKVSKTFPRKRAKLNEVEQDVEHDAEWRRHDEEGTFYLTQNY